MRGRSTASSPTSSASRICSAARATQRRHGRAGRPDGASIAHPAGATRRAGNGEIGVLIRPERPRLLTTATRAWTTSSPGRSTKLIYLGETVKYRIRLEQGDGLVVRWPFKREAMRSTGRRASRVGWAADDVHVVELDHDRRRAPPLPSAGGASSARRSSVRCCLHCRPCRSSSCCFWCRCCGCCSLSVEGGTLAHYEKALTTASMSAC